MYLDQSTVFTSFSFFEFKQLEECSHDHIHVKWDLNMNDCKEVLAFVGGSKILPAKHEASDKGGMDGYCQGSQRRMYKFATTSYFELKFSSIYYAFMHASVLVIAFY
jgi:hypothetical protein